VQEWQAILGAWIRPARRVLLGSSAETGQVSSDINDIARFGRWLAGVLRTIGRSRVGCAPEAPCRLPAAIRARSAWSH